MTTTWLVIVTKQPNPPYPLGYWPRKFARKEDAQFWIDRIAEQNGKAQLTTLEFELMDSARMQ